MRGRRTTSFGHDGLSFDVRDEGPLDAPAVVLLHGFPQRAASWAAVAPLLHAQGWRTLAPDQRGYSPDARPRRRRDYALPRLVGDVVALVEAASTGPVHLVGHDWGAAVAWATAGARPDLVRTLTTVSVPHPEAMVRSLATLDQLRRSWYVAAFQLPRLPEMLLSRPRIARRLLGGVGMDAAMLERFGSEIVDDGALPGGLGWYRALPFSLAGGTGGAVRVPTTHVWSDHDEALGRRGAELSGRYVAGAAYELRVLEGVSHWIPEEAPDRLAEIILERLATSPGR